MSLTLILTRHAKSDWGDPMLSDKARPLNARGQRDAPRIGEWLSTQGYVPARALVSAAERTRETWARVASAFPDAPDVTYVERLYHADADILLAEIRRGGEKTLMLVGHNPGIGETAHRIVSTAPRHTRFLDYPTGATLVCRLDIDTWAEAGWGMGQALDFITPHDL